MSGAARTPAHHTRFDRNASAADPRARHPPAERPLQTRRLRDTPDDLDVAGELLRAGRLVAFPTETVYGLGADATNPDAVAAIFAAKQRPADNPLIVHVGSRDQVLAVATAWTPLAATLADAFWPGPLTLVLPARDDLPRITTGGLETVAVRQPGHRLAQSLLAAAGVPLAAPSANRSGRPSPTTPAHVLADLDGAIDAVVDGGPCEVGVESTVVDARGDTPRVLREGSVTREDLLAVVAHVEGGGDASASPGTRYRHYQPACRVRLAAPDALMTTVRDLAATGTERVGVVSRTALAPTEHVVQLATFADAQALAAKLYGALRDAEQAAVDVVVVETVPEAGVGRAVMDRLRRAAAG